MFDIPYEVDEVSFHIMNDGHALISGATGSGKSTILETFLFRLTHESPTNYRFSIIDLKRTSLTRWKAVPHCDYYAIEPPQAERLIDIYLATMESRLKAMERTQAQKYEGTRYYLIIDESADLLDTCKHLLPKVTRLMRIARATNIFIIYATQSPSRKTIPASIQENVGLQIALRCRDSIASRQIIGEKGAECLPLFGQCIYYSPKNGYTKRVKAVQIPEDEINGYIATIKRHRPIKPLTKSRKANRLLNNPITRFLKWFYT